MPGGGLALDNGSVPIHMFNPNNTQLFAYSGIAADGASGFFPGNSNVLEPDPLPAQLSPLSIEAWVWQFSLNPTPAIQTVFGWNGITAGIALEVSAAGNPSFVGQLRTTALLPITQQRWHYLAGTKTGALEAIYVDGVLSNSAANAVAMNFTEAASIGAVTTATRFFRGWIAEVAFYSYALTAGQVAAHFAAQEVNTPPIFFGNGVLNIMDGGVDPLPTDISDILKAVQKTFPTT